ncbi:MAG: hypothetical protein K0S93_423 [Nitrososphaeraceae archaeon]|nr:hypothetical protein [Nitrososphaeraceae archaeon]
MNKKKGFSKSNTNFNNSFRNDSKQNPYTNKEQTSKESIMDFKPDLTNTAKTTNDIIDIDDSPDIATWNKEVTRNKDVSDNIDNKYIITKINPKIPTITTTMGLERKREENNEKDHLIDPANQREIDNAYHDGDILTDQASFFHNKRKLNKK